jgi:hypothetical protein
MLPRCCHAAGINRGGAKTQSPLLQVAMDVHVALEEVRRWCAQQTADGDPDRIEVDCHAMVCITLGESAPPWRVRWERRCSSGASVPIAQLRYDPETREWALHHGQQPPKGWCSDDDAVHARQLARLLDEIAGDREGRFQGMPPGYRWPFAVPEA